MAYKKKVKFHREHRYAKIFHSMLDSENFRNLSVYARTLYLYMRDCAYGYYGVREFEYSIRLVKSVLNCSLQKASDTIHELEQKGFIERQNNSYETFHTSMWKLSNKWRKYKPTEENTAHTPLTNEGFIYLVKLDKHYKIGKSVLPEQRLKEFTLLPFPLEEICIELVEDYEQVERELHEQFKQKRVRGEWFELNQDDIEIIKKYLADRRYSNKENYGH